MFEKLQKLLCLNPLDLCCKKWKRQGVKKILIVWNRGLGDIPLWLYGLMWQIRKTIKKVEFTFLTRENLAQPFSLLEEAASLVSPSLKRGDEVHVEKELARFNLSTKNFDLVLEKIEPKKWLKWQRGLIIPKLRWKEEFDHLAEGFSLTENEYIGVHLSSETSQFYEKERNWRLEKFRLLFEKISHQLGKKIVLFGFEKKECFGSEVIDLRGETTFLQMISVIKNKCCALIAPDSGILCSIYYLDAQFPLQIISLWGNPNQGILRQKVRSPNKQLIHVPILGKRKEVNNITVEEVMDALLY